MAECRGARVGNCDICTEWKISFVNEMKWYEFDVYRKYSNSIGNIRTRWLQLSISKCWILFTYVNILTQRLELSNSTKNCDIHQIQLRTLSILVRVRESSNSLVSFSLNYWSFCLFSNIVTIRTYQIRIRYKQVFD